MHPSTQRNSLLCPNCRRLISRTEPVCPHCGLTRPGSIWKDNFFTRGSGGGENILKWILGLNIGMFMLSILIDPSPASFSGSPFNFLSPSNNSLLVLGSSGAIPLFGFHRWWSLISASYLHGGLMHIAFNMIALYQLWPILVREYGGSRLFVIYTLSGIGGYFISSLVGVRFTIGASAAVCGLIGAALYYGKSRGGVYGNAVYSQVGGWAVGIFIFGFFVPGINNWGHGGGMLTGALVAFVLGYRERARDTLGHAVLSTACMACTGLVLLWSVLNGVLFLLV